MKKKFTIFVSMLIIVVLLLSACSSTSPPTAPSDTDTAPDESINKDDYFITVATGPTSGLYYPIGGAFSNVLKNKLGYKSSAQSTGASAENINLILEGKADLAITMADAVAQAYEGSGAFEGKEPKNNLRCLMGLYPNYVQLVTTKDSVLQNLKI